MYFSIYTCLLLIANLSLTFAQSPDVSVSGWFAVVITLSVVVCVAIYLCVSSIAVAYLWGICRKQRKKNLVIK